MLINNNSQVCLLIILYIFGKILIQLFKILKAYYLIILFLIIVKIYFINYYIYKICSHQLISLIFYFFKKQL